MSFLLVHGAFRGGWAWGEVRRQLAQAGHDVLAPSLVGMGELADRDLPPRSLHLTDWTDQLVRLAEDEDLRDVVLVGHSQGGLVARAAAPLLAERMAALVYLDAPIATMGQRGVDLSGSPPPDDALPPRSAVMPPTALEAGPHLPEPVVKWMNQRLGPTPVGPSLDRLDTPEPEVDTHIAFCAHTPEGFPSTLSRAALDAANTPYHLFDAAHDVMLTEPAAVVDWLLACAPDSSIRGGAGSR